MRLLAEACRTAAEYTSEDDGLRFIIGACQMADGGAFGFDFVEGLKRRGETWATLSPARRAYELEVAAANEVEAQVESEFHNVLGDAECIRAAAVAQWVYPAAVVHARAYIERRNSK